MFLFSNSAHAAPPSTSRQTRLDSPPPIARYAITAELGNALVGEYAFSGQWAFEHHLSARVMLGYRSGRAAYASFTQLQWGVQLPQSGVLVELAFAWHAAGNGLDGITAASSVGLFGTENGAWLVRVGMWISHVSHVGDTIIELGVGALSHYEPKFQELAVAPQLRCALGISFLE